MQTTVPTRIGRYEILGEIGHGGMATVYRARDTRLDRLVALKVMHPHLRGAPEARARFAREAVTVARLRHPNILEIYDYSGEDDAGDVSFIATELLTGPTLKQFAETHHEIPAEVAACFVIAIARGLCAAHGEGVIHRDVKPENVLIHEKRTVKLTDFGIAQLIDAQSMTTTGTVLGSPGHMAPEQVEGKECDVRSDIFALGTVLYLLATGRLPFAGRNPHVVLKAIVDGNFIDPLQARPSIGGELRAIILRAMHRDPEQRYQTARALEQDLSAFVSHTDIQDPDATLEGYLADPVGFAAQLRTRLIDGLTRIGERAVKQRDMPKAFDAFNRVLALDEGNARVLTALDQIHRSSRTRNGVIVAMTALLVATAAFAAIRLASRTAPTPSQSGDAVTERAAKPSGVPDTQAAPARPVTTPGSKPAAPTTRVDPTNVAPTEAPRVRPVHRPARATEDPTTPRRVVFQPSPANVSIAIDGAAPIPFGPSFREAELSPGVHRFKFIGGHECCVDVELSEKIPPGPGATTLSPRLEYRPAALYVVTNVPADVRVGEGVAQGRTRSVISVPLTRGARDSQQVTISAAGYRSVTLDAQLAAGKVTNLDATLLAAP